MIILMFLFLVLLVFGGYLITTYVPEKETNK